MKQDHQHVRGSCGRSPQAPCGLIDEACCSNHAPRAAAERQRYGSTIADLMQRIAAELEEG
jgi:hypothetical protein